MKLDGDYNLLNTAIYDRLNQRLINKLDAINHLKAEKIKDLQDVEYELYLTPDTMKIKLFTKMSEIKANLQSIKSKIGEWDIVNIENKFIIKSFNFRKQKNRQSAMSLLISKTIYAYLIKTIKKKFLLKWKH